MPSGDSSREFEAIDPRAGEQRSAGDRIPSPVLPILTGLVVFVGSLVIAHELRSAENRSLANATSAALESAANELSSALERDVEMLVRASRRWERGDRLTRSEWEEDARRLVDDFDHMQALEWVDDSFRVRWVVPLEGNEAAVGLDLGFEERRRHALESARDRLTVIATRPVDLVQGGKGFLVYVPLHAGGKFAGFALGVYRIDSAFSAILRNVAPGYDLRVSDGDDALWSRSGEGSLRSRPQLASVGVRDLRWQLQVAPGPQVAAIYRTWLPGIVGVGGSATALILALAVHWARSSRWRAGRLLGANQELREEIERRGRAEAAELSAREEFEAVVNSFPDHVWSGSLGPDGQLAPRYFSDTIGRIAGTDAKRFYDDPPSWIDTIHADDRSRARQAYVALLSGGSDGLSLEYRIERPDGEIRWVRDRVRVTQTPEGNRLDGVIADITAMKRAEEERLRFESQLQEAQKLESLGVLTGGIAHDFNNILVGVLGHTRLLLEDLPADSPARRRLVSIEKAARRAAALCRQMLAYAGTGSFVIERVDLRSVVEEMGELLGASIPKRITIRRDFPAEIPPVEGDPSQLRQVVLNLITNASEAIGDRTGEIVVSLRAVECAAADFEEVDAGEDLEPGSYLALEVTDDGRGMDESTRRRMFEPFFSSKFPGRGLGLAAVLGIVRGHRAAIRVRSEPERGTAITVLFPTVAGRVDRAHPQPPPPEPWRASGTVLLVDDEPDAREVSSLMLERVGFEVLTAEDGPAALDALRSQSGRIACILLDFTMPNMSGDEVLRRLRQIDPEVPVVLCSGYPEGEAVQRFAGLGLAGFVSKPYTPEELIRQVRKAVESA